VNRNKGSIMKFENTNNVAFIYNEDYANFYETFYLHPWYEKHKLNLANLERIISSLPNSKILWLDTCCGQAWHFAHFPKSIERVGIDISSAQLRHASRRNPDALFMRGDITSAPVPENMFNLVTNFWAAYCYLNSYKKITSFIENAVRWLKPGGALYFEILLPADLMTFNDSLYSYNTGFRVYLQNSNACRWYYEDKGGRHNMLSPPLKFFEDILANSFDYLESGHDGNFMTHLIALGKK